MKSIHKCLLGILTLAACTPTYKKYVASYRAGFQSPSPDYSLNTYWAASPFKKDPSDSIPFPLQPSYQEDSSVDVFFLHPTTFGSRNDTAWNANINDPEVNARTDYTTILYQASVFNAYRVFAPRYRQANIKAYYTTDTTNAFRAFDLAYQDIAAAFRYYLEHYNGGRPIIIASHSQGSTHAERLLREFFDGKPLQHQLVAAYIIGMAIPKNYFHHLTACSDSSETGCLVGWRTYKKGYEPEFVKLENGSSIVTNPLNWTTDSTYADKDLNLGAVLSKFNTVLPGVADAQIHDDVLWIHKPHFPGSIFYRRKNYHIGDINLFYVNIRENLVTRIRAFRKNPNLPTSLPSAQRALPHSDQKAQNFSHH